MAATPNELDYFRVGEVFPGIQGKVDNTGFDYYRVGEPLQPMVPTGIYVPRHPAHDHGSVTIF